MTEARRKDQWDHTADLLVALSEPHRDRKRRPRPYTSEDFHPFHRDKPRGILPGTVQDLKHLAQKHEPKGE